MYSNPDAFVTCASPTRVHRRDARATLRITKRLLQGKTVTVMAR
jgi:hypothetical protein